jgi:flagellar hook-length control protein FliK
VAAAVPGAGDSAAGRVVPTVSVALDLLVSRGATTARLHLKPEALGGVDVHLRQTAQGLDVRLSADGAEAARALTQAAEGLRRQLESQGVTVLRLEIADGTTADARGGDAAGRDGQAPGSDGRTGAASRTRVDVETGDDATTLPSTTTATTLALPDGALVDVLA